MFAHLWLAFVCTSVAFMASSYIVIGRQHEWAALLVTVVGGLIMTRVLGIMTYYVVKVKKDKVNEEEGEECKEWIQLLVSVRVLQLRS